MPLQISSKDLGTLAMKGFCPRYFWIQRRTKQPWQIFPGVFSSIDSYSKKVVHGQFDKSGMPGWLAPLGELKGYKDRPAAQKFGMPVEGKPGPRLKRSGTTGVLASARETPRVSG